MDFRLFFSPNMNEPNTHKAVHSFCHGTIILILILILLFLFLTHTYYHLELLIYSIYIYIYFFFKLWFLKEAPYRLPRLHLSKYTVKTVVCENYNCKQLFSVFIFVNSIYDKYIFHSHYSSLQSITCLVFNYYYYYYYCSVINGYYDQCWKQFLYFFVKK